MLQILIYTNYQSLQLGIIRKRGNLGLETEKGNKADDRAVVKVLGKIKMRGSKCWSHRCPLVSRVCVDGGHWEVCKGGSNSRHSGRQELVEPKLYSVCSFVLENT